MRKWKTAALIVALVAGALLPAADADASVGPIVLCEATMWAGQHTDVGTVTVYQDGAQLCVRYATHSGWTLGTVHVHIANDVARVPQNKGGPIPGRFRYQADAQGTAHEICIPCSELPAGELVILAHAETFGPGGSTGACSLELPLGLVKSCITLDDLSYATHTISGAGALDGTYEGWCVDVEGGLAPVCYDVTMVSSLDAANNDVITAPQNWDLINYLLNRVSFWRDGAANATLFDLQWVFWRLADPALTPPEAPSDQALADAILADVLANGEGFTPGDGDVVGVALVHANPDAQETVIGIPYECETSQGGEETAWAGELEFPGRNWARYFTCRSCR